MAFQIKITDAGRAALVNAENNGTAPVTLTEVGVSETAIVPDGAATDLAGEVKRVDTISGEVVAADTMHVTMFDDGGESYSMRAFGLYLADGTLFAIYGQAEPIIIKTAASIASLAIDVQFADVDAASITFGDVTFNNPPATTERQGVVELATDAEAIAGTDPARALTPKSGFAAALDWILGRDGAGSGLDADLLDGKQGSWYSDIIARLGFTPQRAQAGRIEILAMQTPPAGYLVCDGSAVSRTTYAALFAAIGTTFGAGNGSSTFNLPDARGEFIRGLDLNAGVDPGRTIGSKQGDSIKSHHHLLAANIIGGEVEPTASNYLQGETTAGGDTEYDLQGTNTVPNVLKSGSTGGSETRPRNIAFLICITT